jgi:hypothetical protein
MFNIYQKMYSNKESYNLELQTGFLGDELANYNTAYSFVEYYTNSMYATSLSINGPWTNAFSYIYQANAIVEGLKDNRAISVGIKNQLLGEAKFIRAFWFFYLTNCYGDIPMPTSSSYSTNDILSQTPRVQVYQQIVSDLKDAQVLLNVNFVDVSDTATTKDRIRPTSWAAAALLARVYLFTGDYKDAEAQASTVINNSGMFTLLTDLTKVFLTNSNETIWQLGVPLPASADTWEAFNFTLKGAPSLSSMSAQLVAAFEPNDKRRANWVGNYTTTTAPTKTYYYAAKLKSTTSAITEYTMMLRLSEQYLIRAEARVQQGNTNEALSDLNAIRNRAGLPNFSGPTDLGSILSAILHERQVELFTEWGHRWFDIIRSGNVSAIMGSPGNVSSSKGGAWSENAQLFPIPQTEINNDKNLKQNPGY